MRTSLYLINPSANFPAYYGADAMRRLARRPAAFVAGLATATVAACTPSDSLLECGKRQSPGYDLGERISVFVSKGIGVIGGLVVGFDSDAPEIIRDQYDFATSTPVPTFSVNALMAPPSTPLHERVKREGRSLAEHPGPIAPRWTNLEPRQMIRSQLREGIRWLANRLYRPAVFAARMARFIDEFNAAPEPPRARGAPHRDVYLEGVILVRQPADLGESERGMLLASHARTKPATQAHLLASLFRCMQIRVLYEAGGLWSARLGELPAPNRGAR